MLPFSDICSISCVDLYHIHAKYLDSLSKNCRPRSAFTVDNSWKITSGKVYKSCLYGNSNLEQSILEKNTVSEYIFINFVQVLKIRKPETMTYITVQKMKMCKKKLWNGKQCRP